jgi:hypothetical protein
LRSIAEMTAKRQLPTESELRQLPRWAVVVLAVNVARRLGPRREYGAGDVFTRAIQSAEDAASGKHVVVDSSSCRAEAARYVRTPDAFHMRRRTVGNLSKDRDAAYAWAAYHSAQAAERNQVPDYEGIGSSLLDLAKAEAAGHIKVNLFDEERERDLNEAFVPTTDEELNRFRSEASERIRRDFELLRRAAIRYRWTDDSAIEPGFFLLRSEFDIGDAGDHNIVRVASLVDQAVLAHFASNPSRLYELSPAAFEEFIGVLFKELN